MKTVRNTILLYTLYDKILGMLLVSKLPKDRESSWEEYSGQIMVRMNYSLWLKNWHQCYTMTIILCHFPNLIFFCHNTLCYRSFIIRSIFFTCITFYIMCLYVYDSSMWTFFLCLFMFEIKVSCQIKSVSSWSEIFLFKRYKNNLWAT